jgi:hypothetical protein
MPASNLGFNSSSATASFPSSREEANERYWQKRQRAAEQRYQDWAKQQKDP